MLRVIYVVAVISWPQFCVFPPVKRHKDSSFAVDELELPICFDGTRFDAQDRISVRAHSFICVSEIVRVFAYARTRSHANAQVPASLLLLPPQPTSTQYCLQLTH